MAKVKRTPERIQDEIRSYLGEIEYLRSQVGVIDATISNLRTVDATLAYIKEKGEGKEIYIPLGSGIAIKGKIEKPDDVIMDVGAGILVGASIEEARENIEKRINALMELRLALLRKIEEDGRKVTELLKELEKMKPEEKKE
ncbi:prefoldin alpha subunit 1 [Thermococcus cleftensis]|uniref:Prefoldin subunit alpha n=2 Tax=Thermococcus TaxID=2263 RepID=A0A2Z2MDA6_9EURY|nr:MULTISPECIES: prefoldin subunit alpha [Thermococcus]AFL94220.1 prefoldin alpha subunit 1 [Thermococcus cleftensis]ASJ04497.1 prefoldin subunit alpha [Thermococcus barossii]NJE75847.1 prefoldin subunit alpha [Thermococcus sp. ES12]